ncbi:hypothetical protein MYSI104531_27145 [Mycobacterium simiae]
MQRHQRRRARRIHRHRRALQTQHIRHPARRHTRRLSGQPEAFRRRCGTDTVALGIHAGEHAGGAPAQPAGLDSGPLQRLPRQFEEHPLLGIHRERLAGGDAEECRIEIRDTVHEPTAARVAGARHVGVRVVHTGEIPTPVGRELRDHVALVGHHLPQPLGRIHPTREPARHTDDHDRVIAAHLDDRGGGDLLRHPGELGAQVTGQPVRRRVVEDEGRRKYQSGSGFQPIAHFDRGQRVETQVLEGLVGIDRLGRGAAEHGCNVGPDQIEQ